MKSRTKTLAWALFGIYLAMLVWIILFKMATGPGQLGRMRSVNLIPFYYEKNVEFSIHFSEMGRNLVAFVPFGIYLSMLLPEFPLWRKGAIPALFSLGLECAQCLLAVGCSDITDVMMNAAGGILGMGIYALGKRMIREKARLDGIVTALAAVATAAFAALAAVLILVN